MNILIPLTFFVSTTIAFATDPFDGTWKQSNDLSGGQLYIKHDNPPILEIKVVGDKATIHKQDKDYTLHFTLNGTPTRIKKTGKLEGDDKSLKRVHTNVWKYNHDTHGKVQTRRKIPTPFNSEGYYSVSADGQILTMAMLRTYADGIIQYYFRVFEKQ